MEERTKCIVSWDILDNHTPLGAELRPELKAGKRTSTAIKEFVESYLDVSKRGKSFCYRVAPSTTLDHPVALAMAGLRCVEESRTIVFWRGQTKKHRVASAGIAKRNRFYHMLNDFPKCLSFCVSFTFTLSPSLSHVR